MAYLVPGSIPCVKTQQNTYLVKIRQQEQSRHKPRLIIERDFLFRRTDYGHTSQCLPRPPLSRGWRRLADDVVKHASHYVSKITRVYRIFLSIVFFLCLAVTEMVAESDHIVRNGEP